MATGYRPEDQLFDLDMFQSPVFQRPFQYLLRLDRGHQLQDVNPHQVEGTEQDCLRILLRCGSFVWPLEFLKIVLSMLLNMHMFVSMVLLVLDCYEF